MGKEQTAERRKYPRVPTSDVVSFSELDDLEHLGVTKDFSPGGIRFFATGCEIEMGTTLEINFYVGKSFVSAIARVVHATEIDPLTQDVGLEFIELDAVASAILKNYYNESTAKATTGGDAA
jgi:PilZ domain